jgi:uncharacterized protein (TIGR02453 family)
VAASRFAGIPAEAFDFYQALAADNSKTFWAEHKDEYLTAVREPLQAIGAELSDEFGEPHLYRPYRDIRFSKDKTPYKDHQGMFTESRNGLGWYAQVSVSGLMVAGGWYMSTPEQVSRYRGVVAGAGGDELAALIATLRQSGFAIDGQRLKTRPRGVEPDHPHVDLLRHRSLYVHREWEPAAWMGTRRVVTRIRESWQGMTPLLHWLADAVGPGGSPRGSSRG